MKKRSRTIRVSSVFKEILGSQLPEEGRENQQLLPEDLSTVSQENNLHGSGVTDTASLERLAERDNVQAFKEKRFH